MSGDRAERIEKVTDLGAAALLAGACTFAVVELAQPDLAIFAVPIFILTWLGLRKVRPDVPTYSVPIDCEQFEVAYLADELMVDHDATVTGVELGTEAVADAMLLNDALPAIDDDSRVVRLFGNRQEESAANLLGRIERHLGRDGTHRSPDASDALRDALSDLRQSLRNTG